MNGCLRPSRGLPGAVKGSFTSQICETGVPIESGRPFCFPADISRSWLCALHWRTAIAQRCALDHFTLSWRRTSVRHHAFPVVSRSQTDDQELVFVVRLAAVDDDLSANLTAGEVDGVEVHISRSLADGTQRADQVARGDALGGRAGDIRRGDAA